MSDEKVLLQANHIKKYFQGRGKNVVKAVDDVSFSLKKGETLGLVGESGCGKSTLGRTLLRLLEPTEGEILYNGQDLSKLSVKEMRLMRQHMQMVFQNPYSSLNPRMTVLESVRAPLDIFHIGSSDERFEKCREMLKYVGFEEYQIYRYPHEFSGGQRQRIVIARALISSPDFIVCDEPVSALDVSVRAQVLNLMREINEQRGVAYLFISHDLSVVKHVSDRIAVMYLGNMVELAECEELYRNPKHPYTQALLSSIPIPDPDVKIERIPLEGDLPSPMNPPSGCRFHTRCRFATERCKTERPAFGYDENGHGVACHLCEQKG